MQDSSSIAGLHDLLRVGNPSLQALRIPVDSPDPHPLGLPALPSSLRLLHISIARLWLPSRQRVYQLERDRIDEVLEVAACCSPQLVMLMLPKNFDVNENTLGKLARFEKWVFIRMDVSIDQHQINSDLDQSIDKNQCNPVDQSDSMSLIKRPIGWG